MNRFTATGFLFGIALILWMAPSMAEAQTAAEAIIESSKTGTTEELEGLIRSNRLETKKSYLGLEEAYVRAVLSGQRLPSQELYGALERVAEIFETAFGEQGLSHRLSELQQWSSEQLRIKQAADSLFKEADAIRREKSRRPDARELYESADSLYTLLGDTAGRAETRGRLGFVSWYLDRPAYMTYNTEALALRRLLDDRRLIGNTLNDLGIYGLAVTRDYPNALGYFLESEDIREEIGDSLAMSSLLPRIGRTYEGLGDYSNAQKYYLKAAKLYFAVGDTARWIRQRNNAAGLLTDYLGRHSEALSLFLDLEQDLQKINDPRTRALVLNSIGVVNRRLGDYQEAILQYREVVSISEENGFDDLLAQALNNIGVVYIWVNRPERAVSFLKRSEKVSKRIGEADLAVSALQNLGTAHFDLREFAPSDSVLTKAYQESDSLGNPIRTATILTARGNTRLRSQDPDAARADYRMALDISKDYDVSDLTMGILFGLGDAAEHTGDPVGALSYYEQGFETIENARGLLREEEDKAGYLAQSRYLFEDVIHFLTNQALDSGEPTWAQTAFRFAERSKARAFLDQIAESMAGVQEGVDPELLSDQQILTENLASLRQQLAETDRSDRARMNEIRQMMREQEIEFERVERDLRDKNPRYAELQYPKPIDVAKLQSDILSSGDLLLQYAVGDSSSTLWAVSSSSLKIYRLPARADLQAQVDLMRFALSNPAQGSVRSFTGPARELYEELVAPASDLVAKASRLIIIPDDVLHYIPFEVLLTQVQAENTAYPDLAYLIRERSLVYEQSASVWAQLIQAERPATGEAVLAVGDPVFSGAEAGSGLRNAALAPLPFSGTEVSGIAKLFSPEKSTVLKNERATESAVRDALASGDYRFVHFATHGLINDDRPDYSALALSAEDDGNDGLLQASEIFNLKVNADLVVLSACETGLGQLIRGEGVLGLTRAFMYAGAPSLVVSLWSVSDASTSQLMQAMYGRMVADRASKEDALRGAKLDLISEDETAHPFYWAPFVLVGLGK